MKFYFCESCGKRVTEKDIDQGEGKDKKLKGVYCTNCSIGVSTMNTLPMSNDEAKALLATTKDKPKPNGPKTTSTTISSLRNRRKTSATRIETSQRSSTPGDARSSRREKQEKPGSENNLTLMLAAGAVLLVVVLGFALAPGPKKARTTSVKQKKTPRNASTDTSVKSPGDEKGKDKKRAPVSTNSNHNTQPPDDEKEANPAANKPTPADQKKSLEDIAFESLQTMQTEDTVALTELVSAADNFLKTFGNGAHATEVKIWQADWKKKIEIELAEAKERALRPPPVVEHRKRFFTHADELLLTLKEHAFQKAATVAKQTAADKGLLDWSDAAKYFPAVIAVFQKRIDDKEARFKKLIGKVKRFETRKGGINGEVLEAGNNKIRIQRKFVINGKEKLGQKETLSWDQLTSKAQARIYTQPLPATPLDFAAEGLMALAENELSKAKSAFEHCRGHALDIPLQAYWQRAHQAHREATAQTAWEKLTAGAKSEPGEKEARALLEDMLKLEKEFSDTYYIKRRYEAVAKLKTLLKEAAKELERTLEKMFAGTLKMLDAQARRISLTYNFKNNTKQLRDFNVPEGTSVTFSKGKGMLLRWGGHFGFKVFSSKDLTLRVVYAGIYKNSQYSYFELWLGAPKAKSKGLSFRADFRSNYNGLHLFAGGKKLFTSKETFPENGTVKLSSQNDMFNVSINGKEMLSASIPKGNYGPGILIGGGELGTCISEVTVEGTLTKKWLAEHLNANSPSTESPSEPKRGGP